MRLVIVIAAVLASRAAFADCPAGQTAASCALHDEAVAAFTAGKYDVAATKFRAAIAAGPTARSYLGYSQCVEEQGKLALAFETMQIAQKLSNEELAKPNATHDPAIVGRSERIKYKIAELGAKIGYVLLKLPDRVPPQRVVSVYREGEGDLANPIGRWIVVAPNKQIIYASLDDGTRVQMTAAVGPGQQSTLVIPITPPAVIQQPPPPVQPVQPTFVQPPPLQEEPFEKKPPPYPASLLFALDAAFIFRDADGVGTGLGFGAQFEKKLAEKVALTARAAVVFHPSSDVEITPLETASTFATEVLVLIGSRTRAKLPLYASVELGALLFSSETTFSMVSGESQEDYQHTYPAALLGGGIRLGKVHLEVSALAVGNTGDFDLPVRFFATFGVDLVRR